MTWRLQTSGSRGRAASGRVLSCVLSSFFYFFMGLVADFPDALDENDLKHRANAASPDDRRGLRDTD